MLIVIDFSSEVPIYVQIYEQIVLAISNGSLSHGESLPSVRRLGADVGVNIHTINKAYGILRDEGYLNMSRRSGATVALKSPDKQKLVPVMQDRLRQLAAQAAIHNMSRDEFLILSSSAYDEAISNKE